jgi:hypothetical protein
MGLLLQNIPDCRPIDHLIPLARGKVFKRSEGSVPVVGFWAEYQ